MLVSRMSAKEARDKFSDVVSRAYYQNEPTIVERQGKPMAVVISPEQYEQFREQAKRDLFATMRDIQERNKDADPDEVYRDVTAALEEVRQEEYDTRQ